MTLQIRVNIEVAETGTEDAPVVRLDHTETVIPPNEETGDLVALAEAVLSRMLSDLGDRGGEQLANVAEFVAATGGG